MPLVAVKVSGADEAKLKWDDGNKSLQNTGTGEWQTSFNAASGKHYYRISVAGQPNDPWSYSVKDSETTHQDDGHMSEAGRGQSGKRRFDVA
jgi:hypothetical protein